ncbi:MAG: TROVE domain-containing protein [Pyrinomonas sp.]|uniref:TROVE domain-containing protein n=1 Tax=Pyrinomonas sp. TaxID=2080306 RepID=UPI0033289F5F
MARYLRNLINRNKTQREPLPGQSRNSAGGYVWAVDDWVKLDRFLILGSEKGSYYATERQLTQESVSAVHVCVKQDGRRVVRRIVEISRAGRAPKNDPALLALAIAATAGDLETRRAAFDALPQVARTGTHLFHFVAYLDALRGWGRLARRGVARWYTAQDPANLALQLIKYRQRDGWTHRDVLRLCHARAQGVTGDLLYWAVRGWPGVGQEPHPDAVLRRVWALERVQRATTVEEVARLIEEYKLPRETVPTEWLREARTWAALLPHMPMEAMLRNLATMTRIGLIASGSDATRFVEARLADRALVRRARLHPVKILAALLTYRAGHGRRGRHVWRPVGSIIDALDSAFYSAFDAVEPTGRRLVLALDVSGSMSCGRIGGVPGLTPRVASAACALVTAATEPQWRIMAFSHKLVPVHISPDMRLETVLQLSDLPMGATDCALPMLWAIKKGVRADAFIIYTDSETWYGDVHPAEALQRYRDKFGIPAKLIVVGMVSNGFSIADPNDPGMFDVVGFDTATPALISDMIADRGAVPIEEIEDIIG